MASDSVTIKTIKMGDERKKEEHNETEQDVIEVSVFYDKGGSDYFHGKTNLRGYYVCAQPKTLVTDSEGRKWSRTCLGAGFKYFVEEAKRFSAKRLGEVVKTVEASEELQKKLTAATARQNQFAPS